MSVPRHFNQRPRRRLAPPPQRGVSVPVPRVEEVAEEIAEFIEAAVEPEAVVEAEAVVEPVVEAEAVVEPVVESEAVVEPEPVVEPEAVEEAAVESEPPAVQTWNSTMKKAELLAIAQGMGLSVSDTDTKATILEALRAA
jgi:hypothetical protein